jgi:hypothetical protein
VFGPPRLRLRLHLCIRPATPERAKHCVCCGSAPAGPLWTPHGVGQARACPLWTPQRLSAELA